MLVEPHIFPETGRGLRCTRAVSKGEELLAVPLDDCWHAAGALRTAELAPLREAGASLTELDAIALHLLIERSKGEASARWAHLHEMPPAYDTTLFWSAEELEQLRGSAWLELAERFSEEVATDWTALQAQPGVPAILAEYAITFAEYKWAYATVKSRAAELRVGGALTRLLAPRFDMLNHSDRLAPGSSHFFDEARRELVAVAATAYAAGDQAFISYGPAPNGSLLLGGGFVLAHNRFDSVEVCVTAGCDARRLPLLMMVAPDAPSVEQQEASNFEFLMTPDLEELSDGPRPFITRHLLTAQVPLPPALLAYVRVERLSDVELTALERKADKAGLKLWDALTAPDPLDPFLDLLAISALRTVLHSKLRAYPTSLADDEAEIATSSPAAGAANETAPPPPPAAAARRRWLALVLRASEKRILHAALSRMDSMVRGRFRETLALAQAQEATCRSFGLPWSRLLAKRSAALADAAPRISLAYERLAASSLAESDGSAALLVQSASALFLFLGGLATHPFAERTVLVPEASPFCEPGREGAAAGADAVAGREGLAAAMLSCGEDAIPYLQLYKDKMCMWGAYLLAQWGVARALSLRETDTMLDESLALRNAHAWSVPTEDALAAIAAQAPLIEMGAGNGLWADALHARGADVLAFDTPRWSPQYRDADDGAPGGGALEEEGAPLMGERRQCVHLCDDLAETLAEQQAQRALVLMWPDYGGRGSYGLHCLRAYSGSCLVLVGEWRDSTFGAYAPGRPETGQSFSAAFQTEVEASFQRVQVVALPSWPYVLDRVAIWQQREA